MFFQSCVLESCVWDVFCRFLCFVFDDVWMFFCCFDGYCDIVVNEDIGNYNDSTTDTATNVYPICWLIVEGLGPYKALNMIAEY